jgi:hypothetical protein
MMVKKIISGGLTVADQAALDAAISLGIHLTEDKFLGVV